MFRLFPRIKKTSSKIDIQVHHREQNYRQDSSTHGVSSLNNKRIQEKMQRFLRN